MTERSRRSDVSRHIMPTAATMVGVCITVVGIVRVIEGRAPYASIIDNLVAIDAVFFLASTLFSYAALRTASDTPGRERIADILFLVGLVILTVCGVMLAWELGQVPVPVLDPPA